MSDTSSHTVALTVPDISCGHCKRAIEGALGGVAGVGEAVVDVESRTVRMRLGDAAALSAAVAAIEAAGYEVPDPSGAPAE
jgi:copper chaperone